MATTATIGSIYRMDWNTIGVDALTSISDLAKANGIDRFGPEHHALLAEWLPAMRAYVDHYQGGFQFVHSLKLSVRFSAKQAAAIANVMRVDAERLAALEATITEVPAHEPAPLAAVGYYRVNGQTIRVLEGSFGRWEGGRIFKRARRESWVPVLFQDKAGNVQESCSLAARDEHKQAARLIVAADDPQVYGEAYAQAESRCCRCNRPLTVPASIHRGLGPDCAKKEA